MFALRNDLKIGRYDIPDAEISLVYRHIDADGSMTLSGDEVIAFCKLRQTKGVEEEEVVPEDDTADAMGTRAPTVARFGIIRSESLTEQFVPTSLPPLSPGRSPRRRS